MYSLLSRQQDEGSVCALHGHICTTSSRHYSIFAHRVYVLILAGFMLASPRLQSDAVCVCVVYLHSVTLFFHQMSLVVFSFALSMCVCLF